MTLTGISAYPRGFPDLCSETEESSPRCSISTTMKFGGLDVDDVESDHCVFFECLA